MTSIATWALLTLPILTGLQSVLWSDLASQSRVEFSLVNALSYGLLYLLLRSQDHAASSMSILSQQGGLAKVACYAALNIAVSLLWMTALTKSHVGVIGLVEAAYPIFAIAFSILLVGPIRLPIVVWVEAGLIIVGVCLVSFGQPVQTDVETAQSADTSSRRA